MSIQQQIITPKHGKAYWSFERGDVVTRDGSDEHLVLEDCIHGDNVKVLCIKEPNSGWAKVGELEDNCEWRYDFLYRMVNPEILIERIKKKYGIRY
jgi:hypothetical protein